MINITSRCKRHASGFTTVEFVAVLAVMVILITLILPILKVVREAGRKSECLNNLKQLSIAFASYTADYNGYLPASKWWDSTGTAGSGWDYTLGSYVSDDQDVSSAKTYLCPTYVSLHPDYETEPNPIERTYGMSEEWAPVIDVTTSSIENWPHMDRVRYPANTILLAPVKRISATTYNGTPIEAIIARTDKANVDYSRHTGGGNYLFVDGHVSWLSENAAKDTEPYLWDDG